ncbi:efflux RND transporter periplasmic adaptor subunit [Candidatus Binatia bacterium]|nr:efflux RND transporter periplasmic adaptor subunit [Candidatus Binatia bacterium]
MRPRRRPSAASPRRLGRALCGALGAALVVSACARDVQKEAPPPEVTVALPVEREVGVELQATGTVTGLETVEVRARVQGFVEQIHFRAGSVVTEGELLFTIDPRPFRARLAQAEAELAGKDASLQLAQSNLAKARALAKSQVMAAQELDTRTAEYDRALADVALARANVDAAKLDLAYTDVRAPIGGRIGRNLVDKGALVGAADPTLLATIVNDARVYVYFDLSERDLLGGLHGGPSARAASGEAPAARPVLLARTGDDGFPHEGTIDSADNQLDPDTGTLRIRAVFDNPERAIVPGTFVRLKIPTGRERAMLVPDLAVGTDQAGRYVLVVDDANVVERRGVEVGTLVDRMRRVTTGLDRDAWIVVNGLQRARPGTPVTPQRSTVEALLERAPSTPPGTAG